MGYYLVKTKIETEDKPISEQYLIEAASIIDAEAKITKYYTADEIKTTFETVSIQESKIIGVL